MRLPRGFVCSSLLLGALVLGPALDAEEQVLVAGSEGVPLPAKLKHVEPVYPSEAAAQGVRGIVILDLVIDERGQVVSTRVVRSVPGLDEAAIAAARQWRYEPVRVAGRAASVSLTVPIMFALELPALDREPGIPELRQGAAPRAPGAASGGGSATAEVTLASDGSVDSVRLIEGGEPWSDALLAALKAWRFAEGPDDSVVSFVVTARFAAGSVRLSASGLRRTDLLTAGQPEAGTPATPAATAPSATPPSPAVEVVTAPPPSLPPEAGLSLVRDVTLEAGVPELARGRRPVVPPLARISGITGSVEVSFSVGAAGTTLLRQVSGPDALKKAAEETVASWAFRRTRADRIYLAASFTYAKDGATAVVRPVAAPEPEAVASPSAPPAEATPDPAPGQQPPPQP